MHPEVEYDCENERTPAEQTRGQGLSACDRRVGGLMQKHPKSEEFSQTMLPYRRNHKLKDFCSFGGWVQI